MSGLDVDSEGDFEEMDVNKCSRPLMSGLDVD